MHYILHKIYGIYIHLNHYIGPRGYGIRIADPINNCTTHAISYRKVLSFVICRASLFVFICTNNEDNGQKCVLNMYDHTLM